jgi:hypothetical protein
VQIVCERCSAAGPASNVRVEGSVILLTCGTCGHVNRLQGAAPDPVVENADPGTVVEADVPEVAVAPAPPADVAPAPEAPRTPPRDLPPVKCPKCGHRQYENDSCDKCGLVFRLVRRGDRPWEKFTPEQSRHLPEARRLWAAVEALPDDAAAHARFVEHAKQNQLLTFAALQYRHRVADYPDEALTQDYLERVVRDATTMVQALGAAEPGLGAQVARVRTGLLIVVGVLCAIAVALLLRIMAARGTMVP